MIPKGASVFVLCPFKYPVYLSWKKDLKFSISSRVKNMCRNGTENAYVSYHKLFASAFSKPRPVLGIRNKEVIDTILCSQETCCAMRERGREEV